jgi:hypothetical protein
MTRNPYLEKAARLFQFGHYKFALDDLERANLTDDDQIIYDLLKGEIARRLQVADERMAVSLVWRIDSKCWESDWLRDLLRGLYDKEIVGETNSESTNKMLVIDNQIGNSKSAWYRNQYKNGSRICLIHLSDEHFRDDVTSIYRWCAIVYRNLLSPLYRECRTIKAFPLGTKIGFELDSQPIPASQRNSIWGFAGDVKKSTRQQMFEQMKKIPNGALHLTSSFASSDALDVEHYQDFLRKCVFGPCPSGWVSIDSFRVYECLECGTIPIVEKRYNFDYFTELLGPHPMPTIYDWQEAPVLVETILRDGDIDLLQAQCMDWWRSRKASLRAQLRHDIFCHLTSGECHD